MAASGYALRIIEWEAVLAFHPIPCDRPAIRRVIDEDQIIAMCCKLDTALA